MRQWNLPIIDILGLYIGVACGPAGQALAGPIF